MVARVLLPGKTFRGVGYNENKILQGKAEFMSSHNFGFIGSLSEEKCIALMEKMCSKNKRVKNKQFQGVISCEKRDYSPEQLEKIGIEWMELMGYAKQPYLIYFHSDTDNNHIHLVAPRVDIKGDPIEAYMEGERAVRNINKIMKKDISYSAKVDEKKISDFSFSSHQQAKILLEKLGWKVSESPDSINLIKNGTIQHKIEKRKFESKFKNYTINKERQKQLRAIIHKYSQGLNLEELTNLMKVKMGVDLVFHKAKGHDKPYGYTIIDNSHKMVYKGGDIVPLKELLKAKDEDILYKNTIRQKKIDLAESIFSTHLKDGINFNDIKLEMEKYGYRISYGGKIGLLNEKGFLFQIDFNVLKELKYNSRILEANSFRCRTYKEALILSKVFKVKVKDMKKSDFSNIPIPEYYRSIIESSLANKLDLEKELNDKGLILLKDGNDSFLLDRKEKVILNISEYNLDNKVKYTSMNSLNNNDYIDKIDNVAHPNYLESLFNLISDSAGYGDGEKKRRRNTEYNN